MKKQDDSTKNGSVLIVDDQPNNIKVISTLLSVKYKIAIANSGEKTLRVLEKFVPDLILLDIMMPEMDGFEVCKKLKSNAKTKDIPIVFLTAKDSKEDVIKGFELGAVDYITKPFHSTEVLARVKNHIELKQAKSKLELLNKEKDKLFSIIAHDLKNPFGGIINMSKMLKMKLSNSNFPTIEKKEIVKPIELIQESGETAHKLLENLLTWSRTQTGKLQISLNNVPLKSITEHTINLCQSLATNKSIELTSQVSDNIILYADLNMLETVLRNLVTNAIKFTNKNGTVNIQAIPNNEFVTISITDTGIGMKQEKMEKLFNIGENITTRGTENETGTGLGLLICKEFVERNGGKIWVESQEEKGSKFSFTVPTASLR